MAKQRKILVIEDDKSLRGAIVDVLRLKNFLPLEASNGQEGLGMALAEHPDLILLDLLMPVMNGMEALKKIRENEWGKNVPVIVLTVRSATDEKLIEDITSLRPAYYLIKSDWKIHDVVKKIDKILSGKE